jgi:hypothetical protein
MKGLSVPIIELPEQYQSLDKINRFLPRLEGVFMRYYEKHNPWNSFYARSDKDGKPRKVLYQKTTHIANYLIRSKHDPKYIYEAFFNVPADATQGLNEVAELTDMRHNKKLSIEIGVPHSPYQLCHHTHEEWSEFLRNLIIEVGGDTRPRFAKFSALNNPEKMFWIQLDTDTGLPKLVPFKGDHFCSYLIYSTNGMSVYKAFETLPKALPEGVIADYRGTFKDMYSDGTAPSQNEDSESPPFKYDTTEGHTNPKVGHEKSNEEEKEKELEVISGVDLRLRVQDHTEKEWESFNDSIANDNQINNKKTYVVRMITRGNSEKIFWTWCDRDGNLITKPDGPKVFGDYIIPSKSNPDHVYECFKKIPTHTQIYQRPYHIKPDDDDDDDDGDDDDDDDDDDDTDPNNLNGPYDDPHKELPPVTLMDMEDEFLHPQEFMRPFRRGTDGQILDEAYEAYFGNNTNANVNSSTNIFDLGPENDRGPFQHGRKRLKFVSMQDKSLVPSNGNNTNANVNQSNEILHLDIVNPPDQIIYLDIEDERDDFEESFGADSKRPKSDRTFIRCYELGNPWRPFYALPAIEGSLIDSTPGPRSVVYIKGKHTTTYNKDTGARNGIEYIEEPDHIADYLIRSKKNQDRVYEVFFTLPLGADESPNKPFELNDMYYNEVSGSDIRQPYYPYQTYDKNSYKDILGFIKLSTNNEMKKYSKDRSYIVQCHILGNPMITFWTWLDITNGAPKKFPFKSPHHCNSIIYSKDGKNVYECFTSRNPNNAIKVSLNDSELKDMYSYSPIDLPEVEYKPTDRPLAIYTDSWSGVTWMSYTDREWDDFEGSLSPDMGCTNDERTFIRCYLRKNPWMPFYTYSDRVGNPIKVPYKEGEHIADFITYSKSDRKCVYEAFIKKPVYAIVSPNDPIELTDMRSDKYGQLRRPNSPYTICVYPSILKRAIKAMRKIKYMEGSRQCIMKCSIIGNNQKVFWTWANDMIEGMFPTPLRIPFRGTHMCDFIIYSTRGRQVYEAFNKRPKWTTVVGLGVTKLEDMYPIKEKGISHLH